MLSILPNVKLLCYDILELSCLYCFFSKIQKFIDLFIYFLIYVVFLVMPCNLWNLSFPTRNWIQAMAVKAQNLNL